MRRAPAPSTSSTPVPPAATLALVCAARTSLPWQHLLSDPLLSPCTAATYARPRHCQDCKCVSAAAGRCGWRSAPAPTTTWPCWAAMVALLVRMQLRRCGFEKAERTSVCFWVQVLRFVALLVFHAVVSNVGSDTDHVWPCLAFIIVCNFLVVLPLTDSCLRFLCCVGSSYLFLLDNSHDMYGVRLPQTRGGH